MRGYMQDLMNRQEERFLYLFSLVRKNLNRGLTPKEILEFLEEDEKHIHQIINLIQAYPTKDNLELYTLYLNEEFPKE